MPHSQATQPLEADDFSQMIQVRSLGRHRNEDELIAPDIAKLGHRILDRLRGRRADGGQKLFNLSWKDVGIVFAEIPREIFFRRGPR